MQRARNFISHRTITKDLAVRLRVPHGGQMWRGAVSGGQGGGARDVCGHRISAIVAMEAAQ